MAGADPDIMSDKNPGVRVHFSSDRPQTFDVLLVRGQAEVSSVPFPSQAPSFTFRFALAVLFFLSHASHGSSSRLNFVAAGGGSVPHACRAVAGCGWVTADAQEARCGIAVVARGSKTDALPRAR